MLQKQTSSERRASAREAQRRTKKSQQTLPTLRAITTHFAKQSFRSHFFKRLMLSSEKFSTSIFSKNLRSTLKILVLIYHLFKDYNFYFKQFKFLFKKLSLDFISLSPFDNPLKIGQNPQNFVSFC